VSSVLERDLDFRLEVFRRSESQIASRTDSAMELDPQILIIESSNNPICLFDLDLVQEDSNRPVTTESSVTVGSSVFIAFNDIESSVRDMPFRIVFDLVRLGWYRL